MSIPTYQTIWLSISFQRKRELSVKCAKDVQPPYCAECPSPPGMRFTAEIDASMARRGWFLVGDLAVRVIGAARREEAERRLTEIDDEFAKLESDLLDEAELPPCCPSSTWCGTLWPRAQVRVIELLIERVTNDGKAGKISIIFHAIGIKSLAGELAERMEKGRHDHH